MISGLVRPDRGTVELDGVDLAENTPRSEPASG